MKKAKLFYSKIVDVWDGDILNEYFKNHPCDKDGRQSADFKPEPELTQEIEPDLLEIEKPSPLDELFRSMAEAYQQKF